MSDSAVIENAKEDVEFDVKTLLKHTRGGLLKIALVV